MTSDELNAALSAYDRQSGPGPVLTAREQALYEALASGDDVTAKIYASAIHVIGSNNPDRFALGAHAMRELLDRLPTVQVVESTSGGSLTSLVGNLRVDWERVVENSGCTDDGESWNGEIDGSLSHFLKRVRAFLEFADGRSPPRQNRALQFIRETDPMPASLPASIEEHRLTLWQICRDYFVAVSHHGGEISEFDQYMVTTEIFLLDHLQPRTFDDRADLEATIREGERDG